MDISVEGLSSSVVEYEVYHPTTKGPLNLSYCQNTSIQILLPVSINENELDKYDPSSNYYNDICTPSTSESGTDIINFHIFHFLFCCIYIWFRCGFKTNYFRYIIFSSFLSFSSNMADII